MDSSADRRSPALSGSGSLLMLRRTPSLQGLQRRSRAASAAQSPADARMSPDKSTGTVSGQKSGERDSPLKSPFAQKSPFASPLKTSPQKNVPTTTGTTAAAAAAARAKQPPIGSPVSQRHLSSVVLPSVAGISVGALGSILDDASSAVIGRLKNKHLSLSTSETAIVSNVSGGASGDSGVDNARARASTALPSTNSTRKQERRARTDAAATSKRGQTLQFIRPEEKADQKPKNDADDLYSTSTLQPTPYVALPSSTSHNASGTSMHSNTSVPLDPRFSASHKRPDPDRADNPNIDLLNPDPSYKLYDYARLRDKSTGQPCVTIWFPSGEKGNGSHIVPKMAHRLKMRVVRRVEDCKVIWCQCADDLKNIRFSQVGFGR